MARSQLGPTPGLGFTSPFSISREHPVVLNSTLRKRSTLFKLCIWMCLSVGMCVCDAGTFGGRGGGSSSVRITGNFEPPDMDVVKLKLRLLQELEALLFTEPSL